MSNEIYKWTFSLLPKDCKLNTNIDTESNLKGLFSTPTLIVTNCYNQLPIPESTRVKASCNKNMFYNNKFKKV